MREIKFRGILISGEMVYGFPAYIENKKVACGDTGWFISNGAGVAFAYQIRTETLGQYTGLKDRNGKEIYEGDIISFKRLKKENVPVVFIDDGFKISVKTGPCSTRTTGLNYLLSEYQCEVIGNIYEDKHLLTN